MISFRLNRELLNPNFEGYKYSPNFINVRAVKELFIPAEITLNDSYYDFDHLKLLSLTNGLFLNEFSHNGNVAYYFSNDGHVVRIELETDKNDNLIISKVADIKFHENEQLQYPRIIVFVQTNLCVIAHSNSKISLFRIVHGSEELWEFCDKIDLFDEFGEFYLYSAALCEEEKCIRIVACSATSKNLHLQDNKHNELKILDIYFEIIDTVPKFIETRKNAEFKCKKVPSLGRFISNDNSFCCFISEGDIYSDGCRQKIDEASTTMKKKNFTWSQTMDIITIKPTLFIAKADEDIVDCVFKLQSIHFKWRELDGSHKLSLEAKLFKPIICDSCRWTISDNNKLEIHLIKEEPMIWPQLFFDNSVEDSVNSSIEHIIEDEEKHYISEAVSSLDKFTTSSEIEVGKGLGEDDYTEYDCSNYLELYLANIKTNSIEKVETNATQLLFNLYKPFNNTLIVCLDNMEDGIVWNMTMKDQNPSVVHDSTFYALAYVAATKRGTIFRYVERSKQSYYIILDCNGHVLVYENPNLNSSVQSKPRQSSFNIRERPIGATTLGSKIVILTKSSLYVASVNV